MPISRRQRQHWTSNTSSTTTSSDRRKCQLTVPCANFHNLPRSFRLLPCLPVSRHQPNWNPDLRNGYRFSRTMPLVEASPRSPAFRHISRTAPSRKRPRPDYTLSPLKPHSTIPLLSRPKSPVKSNASTSPMIFYPPRDILWNTSDQRLFTTMTCTVVNR